MFQAGYGAVAGRGGARPPTAARVSRGLNRAPTEGACQGGAGSGDGARSTPSLYSVDCSSELGVHRPSSHWENNPPTFQEWMELRDRLSDNCISCWVGNRPGAGPAPMAVMATTRQAGLTVPGAPSSLRLEGPLSPGLVYRRTGLNHCTRTNPSLWRSVFPAWLSPAVSSGRVLFRAHFLLPP